MRKHLIAFASVIATSVSTTYAADLAPVEPQPVPVASGPSWSGCYLGLHGGYGHGQNDGSHDNSVINPDVYNDLGKLNPEGWLGGAHGGCNWQADSLLFGFEADISASDLNDRIRHRDDPANDYLESKIDWLASLRARIGYASGSLLLYGTGGVAWADHSLTDFDESSEPPPSPGKIEFTDHGWVIGGGMEYMMSSNWILRAEYLHYDISETHSFDGLDLPDGDDGDSYSLENVDVFRVGFSYKF